MWRISWYSGGRHLDTDSLRVLIGDKAKRSTLESYCSPSGDFCTAVTRRGGRIKFEISTFSFSGKYDICVKGPAGKECKSSKLQSEGNLYSDRVDWLRKFASAGPGRQKVVWKLSGTTLGEPLHFQANVAKQDRSKRGNKTKVLCWNNSFPEQGSPDIKAKPSRCHFFKRGESALFAAVLFRTNDWDGWGSKLSARLPQGRDRHLHRRRPAAVVAARRRAQRERPDWRAVEG